MSTPKIATWDPGLGEMVVRDATPEEVAEIDARAAVAATEAEAQAVAAYEAGVQQHLDSTAWLYGYDNLISAITYAEEPAVEAFQIEGQAFRAWRSLVWIKCREVLAQYKAGERPAPTLDELIGELPLLDLPAPMLGRTVQ